YKQELAKLERGLAEFRAKESLELQEELRTHVGDYLTLVWKERRKRDGDDLSAIFFSFQRGEPRPQIARRWSDYLSRHAKLFDPVFSLWHRYSALPSDEAGFTSGAQKILDELAAGTAKDPKKAINPHVRQAFVAAKPTSMPEVIKTYNDLFHAVQQQWNDALAAAKEKNAAAPAKLDDAAAEQLREVLYGNDSPATLAGVEIESLYDRKTRDEQTRLEKKIETLKVTSAGAPPRAMVLNDAPKPTEPAVFVRGNPSRRGKKVPRQFLEVIAGPQRQPFAQGSGRLEMARAIVAADNPLTARVLVNRVWMHHFGKPIVSTPSDFGTRSDPPTHPELLDWLAATFMEEGWSIKSLHRKILLSSAYQQASVDDPQRSAIDPENRWLWRMNRQRLEFEPLRDSMLTAAGKIDRKMGGRPVSLTATPATPRRTIYGLIDRQDMPGVLLAFDFPSPDVSADLRPITTVPQQALFAMNSPFALEMARAVAQRPDVQATKETEGKIRALFRATLARDPSADELARAEAFVARPASAAEAPTWQYGYGRYDAKEKRLADFQPFKHFVKSAWQPGAKLPDAKLAYLNVGAEGGHPGRENLATVLRWTAPSDMVLKLSGTLQHPSDQGDGVEAFVFSSRQGQLRTWSAKHKKTPTTIDRIEVERGETLDFVVGSRGADSYDSYGWSPLLESVGGEKIARWSASDDFHGPLPPPLDGWQMLAHVLMLTNEFVFVD
ncbi:MAG TPA: DUF1553 domain-containing protein, partial [Pirellulales bacterium]|nr:DUF1553 domain-containing protein [Pirellulales bacterium]